jgi:hypothetical protein
MDVVSIVVPSVLGLAAILLLLVSGRVRAICLAIFKRPNQRSILLEINGDTLELNNVSQEDIDKLVTLFLGRQTSAADDGGETASSGGGNDE